jgi:hypothetical protein
MSELRVIPGGRLPPNIRHYPAPVRAVERPPPNLKLVPGFRSQLVPSLFGRFCLAIAVLLLIAAAFMFAFGLVGLCVGAST